jgi:hypothetical protein
VKFFAVQAKLDWIQQKVEEITGPEPQPQTGQSSGLPLVIPWTWNTNFELYAPRAGRRR